MDTNIVIAHFRNDPDLTARLAAVAPVHLPWVVLGELYYGAQRARRREEQVTFIRDFLRTATLLLPDEDTAEVNRNSQGARIEPFIGHFRRRFQYSRRCRW